MSANSAVDYVEILAENEEFITEHDDTIVEILDRQFSRDRKWTNDMQLIRPLEDSLRVYTDEDTANSVALGVLNFCLDRDIVVTEQFSEYDVSQDFLESVVRIYDSFHPDVLDHTRTQSQGKDWWSHIDSELKIKQGVALSHRLILGFDEEVNFDSNVGGNLVLANHFLGNVIRAIDEFDENAVDQIGKQDLAESGRLYSEIISAIENEGYDLGIEADIEFSDE